MFLGYAFDLLGKKKIKGFGEQILHTFQAYIIKLHKNMDGPSFEKVLRFAGFEETKSHYEEKTTTDWI